jgi:hypothetical protein
MPKSVDKNKTLLKWSSIRIIKFNNEIFLVVLIVLEA